MKGVDKRVDSVDSLPGRNYLEALGSSRPLLMGIDPGLGGAVAVVDSNRNILVDLIDIPTFKKETTARKSGFFEYLDVHQLSSLIDMYAPFTAFAVLEEPGAMPKQGLGSTFRFGHVCGAIHGVLAGHYIPVWPVKPAVWKCALALSENKNESRAQASLHFPANCKLWARKMDNDRAEAVLLTVYAKKYLKSFMNLAR